MTEHSFTRFVRGFFWTCAFLGVGVLTLHALGIKSFADAWEILCSWPALLQVLMIGGAIGMIGAGILLWWCLRTASPVDPFEDEDLHRMMDNKRRTL